MLTRGYYTQQEIEQIREFDRRAAERRQQAAERNGVCPCRCRVPLNDDGSNSCGCCNQPYFDPPEDLD